MGTNPLYTSPSPTFAISSVTYMNHSTYKGKKHSLRIMSKDPDLNKIKSRELALFSKDSTLWYKTNEKAEPIQIIKPAENDRWRAKFSSKVYEKFLKASQMIEPNDEEALLQFTVLKGYNKPQEIPLREIIILPINEATHTILQAMGAKEKEEIKKKKKIAINIIGNPKLKKIEKVVIIITNLLKLNARALFPSNMVSPLSMSPAIVMFSFSSIK